MARLAEHGQERHAPPGGQLLRYRNGRPITSRRYDGLWTRIGRVLPWVRTQQISMHWIRHILSALFPCSDSRRRRASGPAACAVRLPPPRCRLSRYHVTWVSLQLRQAKCDTGTTERGECGDKAHHPDVG